MNPFFCCVSGLQREPQGLIVDPACYDFLLFSLGADNGDMLQSRASRMFGTVAFLVCLKCPHIIAERKDL